MKIGIFDLSACEAPDCVKRMKIGIFEGYVRTGTRIFSVVRSNDANRFEERPIKCSDLSACVAPDCVKRMKIGIFDLSVCVAPDCVRLRQA